MTATFDKSQSGGIDVDTFVRDYLDLIARNINRLRGRMSQQEFADRAGISRTTVQRMESGKEFTISSFLRIAATYGILPTDLCLSESERAQVQAKMDLLKDALKDEIKKELLAELRGPKK